VVRQPCTQRHRDTPTNVTHRTLRARSSPPAARSCARTRSSPARPRAQLRSSRPTTSNLRAMSGDQVVLFVCLHPVRHCARLWARSLFVISDFQQGPGSLPTLPPDLGIGRHGAVLLTALRLRVSLRHRIISRTGRSHQRGNPLEMRGCFTPSRDHRGALEERRGPFGDPFCVKRPVSEGRMALPTPFETKRKKAPIGALGRIQYLSVAEREGFEPPVRSPVLRISSAARSTTLPPLRLSRCPWIAGRGR
jgi:hypothetical protein